jgi:hypothetical protein
VAEPTTEAGRHAVAEFFITAAEVIAIEAEARASLDVDTAPDILAIDDPDPTKRYRCSVPWHYEDDRASLDVDALRRAVAELDDPEWGLPVVDLADALAARYSAILAETER